MRDGWSLLPSREQASCPDTPPLALIGLADRHPRRVLANPVLPLVMLTDPWLGTSIHEAAELRLLEFEVRRGLQRLSSEQLRQVVLTAKLPAHTHERFRSAPVVHPQDVAPFVFTALRMQGRRRAQDEVAELRLSGASARTAYERRWVTARLEELKGFWGLVQEQLRQPRERGASSPDASEERRPSRSPPCDHSRS